MTIGESSNCCLGTTLPEITCIIRSIPAYVSWNNAFDFCTWLAVTTRFATDGLRQPGDLPAGRGSPRWPPAWFYLPQPRRLSALWHTGARPLPGAPHFRPRTAYCLDRRHPVLLRHLNSERLLPHPKRCMRLPRASWPTVLGTPGRSAPIRLCPPASNCSSVSPP